MSESKPWPSHIPHDINPVTVTQRAKDIVYDKLTDHPEPLYGSVLAGEIVAALAEAGLLVDAENLAARGEL